MENYSVLMSVYAKEKPEFLKLAVESVFDQTVKTNDFVLVCDGPLTEQLDSIIKEMLETYSPYMNVVRLEKNVGLGPALNEGLKHCKNELVARMDSDDYMAKDRAELQLKKFSEDDELVIVGGAIEEFEGSPENITSGKSMPETHEQIIKYSKIRSPFNHPTVMYKKTAVLELGGYPDLRLHEDYGLWVALLMSGAKGCNLPQTLCYMRVDSGLYDRRGGFKYFKTAAGFRIYMHKIGYSGFMHMCYGVGVLAVVCLVPTFLRKAFYRIFLRK